MARKVQPPPEGVLWAREAADLVAARPDLARLVLRAAELSTPDPDYVRTPGAAAVVARRLLQGRETEALMGIALNSRARVIDAEILSVGSAGCTIVDPPTVFRWALTRKHPTTKLIIAHNHPSGDPSPSTQDEEVTRRMAACSRTLGLPLLDHVIVIDWFSGEEAHGVSFYSFAEAGELAHIYPGPLCT